MGRVLINTVETVQIASLRECSIHLYIIIRVCVCVPPHKGAVPPRHINNSQGRSGATSWLNWQKNEHGVLRRCHLFINPIIHLYYKFISYI